MNNSRLFTFMQMRFYPLSELELSARWSSALISGGELLLLLSPSPPMLYRYCRVVSVVFVVFFESVCGLTLLFLDVAEFSRL